MVRENGEKKKSVTEKRRLSKEKRVRMNDDERKSLTL